jgi:hypothetical protein
MGIRSAKLIAASVLSLSAAPVPAFDGGQDALFSCDVISDDMVEVFSGIGPPSILPIKHSGPIAPGTEIFAADTPLLLRYYTPGNQDFKRPKQTIFRDYIVDGAPRICTATPDNRLFGKGDRNRRFRLRCLIDDDGDGAYEAAMPVGKYVRYNPVTGRIVTGPQPPPSRITLPAPIRLTGGKGAPNVKSIAPSFINSRMIIGAIEEDTAEIIINSAVNVTPEEPDYALVGDRKIIVAKLVDGAGFEAEGARFEITQSAAGWNITVRDYQGPNATLQCGGQIIAMPRSQTWITAEQQRVLLR